MLAPKINSWHGADRLSDHDPKSAHDIARHGPGWTTQIRWVINHPVLLPCLLLAAQTIPALWAKDVWFSDEARHAAALLQLTEHGHWLVLYLGEHYYPDKPPLYFWMLAAISRLFQSTEPFVFMIGAALSAFAFLIATIRSAAGFGLSRNVALLAGLLLVGNYYFVERGHFPRMDLLFATFILLSHLCFYRTATAFRPPLLWAASAFFLAALATLTKGPIGLLLPLAGVVVFLVLERQPKRLISHAMIIGSLVFFVPIALYLLGVYLVSGTDFIRAILIDQTIQRAVASPRLAGPFYYYIHKLPEIFLPWSLLIFFLPWRQIFSGRHQSEQHSRAAFRPVGRRYISISALTSLIIISSFDYKITFLLITLLPQVTLLCAIYINQISQRRRTALFALITLLYICAAAAIPFAANLTLWPNHVRGEYAVALAILPLIAGMLLTVKRRALVFCTVVAIGTTIVSLPYFLITVRGLDAVMSPRAFGEILGGVAKRRQTALYYHPFRSGIFDYHAQSIIPYLDNLEIVGEHIKANECGVLAMRTSDWVDWTGKPNSLAVIAEHQLDYETYVLVGWGSNTCRLPATVPPQQM